MKYFLNLLVSIIIISLLTGCVTTEVRLVESQKYVLIEPDAKYLQDCKIEPPPAKELYLAAGHDEREDMLTRTLLTQYTNIKLCTSDKQSLRSLMEKQKADVEAFNASEEERIKKLGVKK